MLLLAQTNLEVNNSEIFIYNNMEFYKTTDKTCVVDKMAFDNFGRDCLLYGLKVNAKIRKNLIKK